MTLRQSREHLRYCLSHSHLLVNEIRVKSKCIFEKRLQYHSHPLRIVCPSYGHMIARFATKTSESTAFDPVVGLNARCPARGEEVRNGTVCLEYDVRTRLFIARVSNTTGRNIITVASASAADILCQALLKIRTGSHCS